MPNTTKLNSNFPHNRPTRVLRLIVIFLLILLLISACTGGGGEAITPTEAATQAATQPVAAETTEAPTATATVEATKSPQDIADSLGLNDAEGYADRTYTVKGDLLIDNYNGAPKAIMESGSWRELDYHNPEDAEVMYGDLVKPEYVYIKTDKSILNNGKELFQLQMVYLGDVSWEPEVVNGGEVTVPYLLMGIRDGAGVTHVVKYGFDGVREGSEHPFEYWTRDDSGVDNKFEGSVREAIASFSPGDTFFELEDDPNKNINATSPQLGEADVIARTLFNQNKAMMLSHAEWEGQAQGGWPDRVVYIYNFFNGLTRLQSPLTNWQ